MHLIVAICGNVAALPDTIPVRITTTTALPDLYLAVTSVAVVMVTAAISAVSTVVNSVVTDPVPVVIFIVLISSGISAFASVAPRPLDITFVTVDVRFHGGHAVEHSLYH